MAMFKILQTLGALAMITAFFLPWSGVNFGSTMGKMIDSAMQMAGAAQGLGAPGGPTVAGAASAVDAASGGMNVVKDLMNIPTGSFSGLDLALSSKLMLLNFAVPGMGLVVLLLSWLTMRGTGKVGVLLSFLALAALMGSFIMSAMGGMMKQSTEQMSGAQAMVQGQMAAAGQPGIAAPGFPAGIKLPPGMPSIPALQPGQLPPGMAAIPGGQAPAFPGAVAASPPGMMDMLKNLIKHLFWGFWFAAGATLLTLLSSFFAKKPERSATAVVPARA